MAKKASKKIVKKKVSTLSLYKQKLLILLSLILVLSGIVQLNRFVTASLILFPKEVKKQTVQKAPLQTEKRIKLKEQIHLDPKLQRIVKHENPTQIVIPKVSIDMHIVEADVKDGYWEVAETSANHGMGTAYPGQKGNMVVFAHARIGMFLPLRNIAKDDEVYIFTKNKWYTYKVAEIKEVLPHQVEVVEPTKDERLTIFTCTGFADEKRLIVVAKPTRT